MTGLRNSVFLSLSDNRKWPFA